MRKNRIDIKKNSNIEEISEMLVYSWASFFREKDISENANSFFLNSLTHSLFTTGMGYINCKLRSRHVFGLWKNSNKENVWSDESLESLQKSVESCLLEARERK